MAFWCQPTDFEEECKWRGEKIQQCLSLKACGSPSTGHQQKQQQPLNEELAKHMRDTRSWLSEPSTRVCAIACASLAATLQSGNVVSALQMKGLAIGRPRDWLQGDLHHSQAGGTWRARVTYL